jgi:site-specific recombinase XerD
VPSISAQKRNGNIVGYSVYLGTEGDERRVRKFFPKLPDAEKFIAERTQSPVPVGELWEKRMEILYNLDRLRSVETTLTDAVSFYLNHRVSPSSLKLTEVLERFLTEKKQVGRSPNYEQRMRYGLGRFIAHLGTDRKLNEVSRQDITDYVYRKNGHASPVTKRNLIADISVLYNYARREDLTDTNPTTKVPRPTIPFTKPSVLTPTDFESLLKRCLTKGWKDRLTLFVLVGFCGIRTEEASRLTWSNLDLTRKIVEVPASVAKKASFRNNRIPPNAVQWLERIHDKRRTGPLIGKNWKTLLRSASKYLRNRYTKNCIRHSFCSYALSSGWSLADVVAAMGHGGSPTMVFSHYRNVVSEEDGKRWFSIVPPTGKPSDGIFIGKGEQPDENQTKENRS